MLLIIPLLSFCISQESNTYELTYKLKTCLTLSHIVNDSSLINISSLSFPSDYSLFTVNETELINTIINLCITIGKIDSSQRHHSKPKPFNYNCNAMQLNKCLSPIISKKHYLELNSALTVKSTRVKNRLIKIRNFTDWTNKVKDILGAKPKEALKCILDWKCGIIMN